MGYEQFFGLNDAPFSLAPNPRYLFESASHAAALQQLTYAIERREPLIVMTGEIGTGKTLLARTVVQRLGRQTFVSVINNPLLERDDLLRQMLQDFGVVSTDRSTAPTTSRHDLVHALEDFLASLIPLNAHAVVIVDEAQHVRPDVLEQIRLLSNVDTPGGTMLQIVLIGQLDLETLLARPDLRQVQQRVSRRIRLEPLDEAQLASYIDHRLAVGRSAESQMPGAGDLARAMREWHEAAAAGTFTGDAVRAIWRWSHGLPRVVNLLCDRALEVAYERKVRSVDGAAIDAAALALGLLPESVWAPAPDRPVHVDASEPPIPASFDLARSPRLSGKSIAALAAVAAIVSAGIWFATRPSRTAIAGSANAQAAVRQAPPAPPRVQPAAAPPTERAAEPPAATTPTPAAAVKQSETAPAPAAPGAFEIVVASFRTEARASAVAAQVSEAGLPVRRRETSGWQQIVAGPFKSRDEADAARQRLDQAGLTGTSIVATAR